MSDIFAKVCFSKKKCIFRSPKSEVRSPKSEVQCMTYSVYFLYDQIIKVNSIPLYSRNQRLLEYRNSKTWEYRNSKTRTQEHKNTRTQEIQEYKKNILIKENMLDFFQNHLILACQ